SSQLGPNKGQPEVANHSHSRAQPCGRGARMVLKIVFYVFFYHCGKLFNCERGHINRNVGGSHFGLRNSKSPRVALGATAASILPSSLSSWNQPRPQSIATDVVRLPPMLNVRNLFTFSIWRAPACWLSC